MIDWSIALKTAQEWLSKSIPAQLAVAIASGVVLFGPEWMIAGMGLRAIRDDYRPVLGGALLIIVSLLCAEGASTVLGWGRQRIVGRRNDQIRIRRLHDLTPHERVALRGYLEHDTRTRYFQPSNGVAQGLVHAQIIYRAANLSSPAEGFAYNVQPWAWHYLRAHPELVELEPEQRN